MALSASTSAAKAMRPPAAPQLDFEALLSRDLQDHRPARVTRMVPRERFKPNEANIDDGNGESTDDVILAAQHPEAEMDATRGGNDSLVKDAITTTTTNTTTGSSSSSSSKTIEASKVEANKLVRTLVATTPAFVEHMEATHASAKEEEKREWKASLISRTRALLEELTGSNPNAIPPTRYVSDYDDDDDGQTRNKSGFDSKLHGVELSDWESKIQWDGLKDEDDNDNDNHNNKLDPKAALSASSGNRKPPTDPLQLLQQRRNHWLDNLEFDNTVNWEGTLSKEKPEDVPLLLELGVAGQSVARHSFPSGRPPSGVQSAEYQARMEKEWQEGSTQITSTADVSRAGSLHADREKMEKLIEQRQKKRAQMAVDKTSRVLEAMGTLAIGPGKGRTITSSLMGPGGTERTGRPSRHNVGTTSAHELEYIDHLDMVINHELVRDLSKVSLREYHRPKLPRNVVRQSLQWQFQIRYQATTGSKPNAPGGRGDSTSYQSIMMGTHPGAVSKAKLRTLADLSPSEGKLVLLEYCEERPPCQLTTGMASKIVNYFRGDKARCPVSRGGGDRPTRKKKRSDNESPNKVKSATKNSLFGDRPPRLEGPDRALRATASDWIGKIPKKTHEGDTVAKNNLVDMLPEGVTEMLHPKVHGPVSPSLVEKDNWLIIVAQFAIFRLPYVVHWRSGRRHEDFCLDRSLVCGSDVSTRA